MYVLQFCVFLGSHVGFVYHHIDCIGEALQFEVVDMEEQVLDDEVFLDDHGDGYLIFDIYIYIYIYIDR